MFVEYLLCVGKLVLLTLGAVAVCGLAVWLCSDLFLRLTGAKGRKIAGFTSLIGTPVHELGHAVMCVLFGHKILRMRLCDPLAEDGKFGFVEHSWNPRNPWATFGNLFIGLGPIFSGMGVTVLMLWLCFPDQWSEYLTATREVISGAPEFGDVAESLFSLFRGFPAAFRADFWRSLVGVIVILNVAMHVSLSPADVKGSVRALAVYLVMILALAGAAIVFEFDGAMIGWLILMNLRVVSLFGLLIAFSVVWVLIAAVIRLLGKIVKLF